MKTKLSSPVLLIVLAGIATLISVGTFIENIFMSLSLKGILASILVDGGVMFVAVALLLYGIGSLPKKEKHVRYL